MVYDIRTYDSDAHYASFWYRGPKDAEWHEPKSGNAIVLQLLPGGWVDADGSRFGRIETPYFRSRDRERFKLDCVRSSPIFSSWDPDAPIASWLRGQELSMQLYNELKPARGAAAYRLDREGIIRTNITEPATLCGLLLLYEATLYDSDARD